MRRAVLLGLGALAVAILGACYDPDGLREDREDAQREVFEDRFDAAQEATPTATPDPDATVDPNDPGSALIQGITVTDYFASICAACHGVNREGGVGPELSPSTLTEPDDFYIDTLKNGREGTVMLAYGGGNELTDDEVAAMVTWLKTTEP